MTCHQFGDSVYSWLPATVNYVFTVLVYRLFGLYFILLKKMETLSALLALCARNSLVTSEVPAQRASNAENVSIWWRHHAACCLYVYSISHDMYTRLSCVLFWCSYRFQSNSFIFKVTSLALSESYDCPVREKYHQNFDISRILVGNTFVDHSGVVGASPVAAYTRGFVVILMAVKS